MQNLWLSLNALFRGTKVAKHPFYSIGPKWCFGVFRSISLIFGIKKDAKLVFEPERTISGYQSCEACILLHWTKMVFRSVSKHFANLQHIKTCKNCVAGLMHYFGVMKSWSIHSTTLEPKSCLGVFWSVLLTFGTYKWHNLCSSLKALFLLHWTQIDVWECFGAFH
jgi:hypothetical protein